MSLAGRQTLLGSLSFLVFFFNGPYMALLKHLLVFFFSFFLGSLSTSRASRHSA